MNAKQRRKARREWVRENITKRTIDLKKFSKIDAEEFFQMVGWTSEMIDEVLKKRKWPSEMLDANRALLPVTREGSEKVLAKIQSVILLVE